MVGRRDCARWDDMGATRETLSPSREHTLHSQPLPAEGKREGHRRGECPDDDRPALPAYRARNRST